MIQPEALKIIQPEIPQIITPEHEFSDQEFKRFLEITHSRAKGFLQTRQINNNYPFPSNRNQEKDQQEIIELKRKFNNETKDIPQETLKTIKQHSLICEALLARYIPQWFKRKNTKVYKTHEYDDIKHKIDLLVEFTIKGEQKYFGIVFLGIDNVC